MKQSLQDSDGRLAGSGGRSNRSHGDHDLHDVLSPWVPKSYELANAALNSI
jgi:hypothetical protein